MKYIISIIFTLFFSAQSFCQAGGALLDVSAFYFQTKEQRSNAAGTSTTKYEQSYLFWGLGVCYRINSFCFGGKYFTGEIGTLNSNGIVDGNIEYEGFGLSAGYVGDAFTFQLSYLLEAEKRLGDAGFGGDTTIEYPAKQAYLIDIGYGFKLGSLMVGPMLRIADFTYDKRTVSGQSQDLAQTEKDSYQMPMFALWFYF